MALAIFGKLPAKRDFVAVGLPNSVLRPWETWLEAALAASRTMLDARWNEAYLKAPVWRFWLGPDVLGQAVLGVLMPSSDGVGRLFPLSLLHLSASAPPPNRHEQSAFYEAAELLALSALDQTMTYEAFLAEAEAHPDPDGVGMAIQAAESPGEALWFQTLDTHDFTMALAEAEQNALGNTTFWWTLGGNDFPPALISARGLPPVSAFATFLTGVREPRSVIEA